MNNRRRVKGMMAYWKHGKTPARPAIRGGGGGAHDHRRALRLAAWRRCWGQQIRPGIPAATASLT
jgi:hypothetical protein